jgi:hypothetical protein
VGCQKDSLDFLFFKDLDLNHPQVIFSSSDFSFSLPSRSLLIVLFRLSSCKEEKPRTIIQKLQLSVYGLAIQNQFDSFARGTKNPLSAFVDDGNDADIG